MDDTGGVYISFSFCVQVGPFSLRVVGVVGITYLLPQDERPLCHPTVERSVQIAIVIFDNFLISDEKYDLKFN